MARALLAGPATIWLESSVRLARHAGVSAPTVSRFIAQLGFASYGAFQRVLHEELNARVMSPVEVYRQHELARRAAHGSPGAGGPDGDGDLLGNAIDRRAEDDAIGVGGRVGKIKPGLVNGAEPTRVLETSGIATDAENALGEAAFLRRQADGAANEPDADDGQCSQSHESCYTGWDASFPGSAWERELLALTIS